MTNYSDNPRSQFTHRLWNSRDQRSQPRMRAAGWGIGNSQRQLDMGTRWVLQSSELAELPVVGIHKELLQHDSSIPGFHRGFTPFVWLVLFRY